MGQICKLPSTPDIHLNSDVNHIKQMTQQDELQYEEEENKLSEQNQSFFPGHQISMQLSCTPELSLPPQQTKIFSQQDSQYTPEFLAISYNQLRNKFIITFLIINEYILIIILIHLSNISKNLRFKTNQL